MASYSAFSAYYDLFSENIDYTARARYFDTLLTDEKKARGLLLDLACGTGNLSLTMSALGYDVIAVDASPEMLSIARIKAEKAGKNLMLLNQRMEQLDLFGTVDHCVCALDSINHLTNASALRQTMKRVALFVVPGGRFVFDANTPYKHSEILADNTFVYEKNETVCIWRNQTKRLVTHITLDYFTRLKNGSYNRTSESFSDAAFSRKTIEKLLIESGFSIDHVYGDDTFLPPSEKTQRYIFVATRK
jgi:2-polyprenyl-3-methyl-5-hydroxy-6-metoxy-1,4-benzoquinol methylase